MLETDNAALWLVVSRPPASMMMWSYFFDIFKTSVRTDEPVSFTQVYDGASGLSVLRALVKSNEVS